MATASRPASRTRARWVDAASRCWCWRSARSAAGGALRRAVHRRGQGGVLARRDLHRAGQPRAGPDRAHCRPGWSGRRWSSPSIGFVAAWWSTSANEGMGARHRRPARAALDLSSTTSGSSTSSTTSSSCAAPRRWATCSGRAATRRSSTASGPTASPRSPTRFGRRAGRLQTGYVYHYAFVMLLGVAGLLTFALYAWSR